MTHLKPTSGAGPLLTIATILLFVMVSSAACSSASSSDGGPHLDVGVAKEYRGVLLLPPLERPSFTLTDTSGQPFVFARATHGQLTLLFFGYTNCPDICPTTMTDIATALKAIDGPARARVKVVFVTTDPRRDQPSVLRRWLDNFDPGFVGLTGEQAAINRIMSGLRLPHPIQNEATEAGYTVSHVSDVIAFTADDVAHIVYPEGTTPADWQHDLQKLIAEGWHEPKG